MIDTLFDSARVRARLTSGPLGPYLATLTTDLHVLGYAVDTIRRNLRSSDAFFRWLLQQGLSVADASEATITGYVGSLGRLPDSKRLRGRLPSAAIGLRPVVKLLRHYGAVAPESQAATTETGQWLDSFDQHLKCVIGRTTGTRQTYLRYARHLMESRFALTMPDWQRLEAQEVADFVRRETEKLTPSHCRMPATATRAFLRFLVFKGEIHSGLLGVVPPIREWKHASLPLHLSDEELTRLIAVSEEPSATRYRDRAILLLLVRLGLRANEVVNLRLDDIDWVQGCVIVQAGKTHRERNLPLAGDVGEALVEYLKHERPKRNERYLFLGTRAPLRPLKNSSAITPIVTRLLKRANICRPHMGAHVLRHTAATKMLCAGAPFKQIADVLGHQSLRSTTIYAKLNLEMLAQVALPWPGGAL